MTTRATSSVAAAARPTRAASSSVPSSASRSTTSTMYGLLSLGGPVVALPLSLLREVVPCPATFEPLPCAVPELLGTVVLRELIIPVIDIRPLATGRPAGTRSDAPTDEVVAIVVLDGRVLGLVADDVRGVLQVDDARLQELATGDGRACLFTHCFEHPDGGVVSLLDGEAVFSLRGVPAVREAAGSTSLATRRGEPGGSDASSSPTTPMLLTSVGDVRLAIDVETIRTVLPVMEVRRSVLEGALCRGVTEFRDLDIPVADVLHLVGLGTMPVSGIRQGIVLGFDSGFVALALTDVHEITRVPLGEVRPLPAHGIVRTGLFLGVWTAADGTSYLVIDGDRLHGDRDLRTMAALNTSRDGDGDRAAAGASGTADAGIARAGDSYLTYSIGIDVATPFDQIGEIVPYPARLIVAEGSGGASLGLFLHRDVVVPLVDLSVLLGRPVAVDPTTAQVVIVRRDGGEVGFVVRALRAIEVSRWEAEDDGTVVDASYTSLLDQAPLVQIGEGDRDGLVPRIDLAGIVHTMQMAGTPAPHVGR